MKYFLAFAIALILLSHVFELAPSTKAPAEKPRDSEISATIIKSSTPEHKPKTTTLLRLLEIAIDKEHDLEKGLDLMEKAAPTEENLKLIDLYEAKILARTLDFEKARQLLEGLDDESLVLVKAAVLIAGSDRNQAGGYLHELADHHSNPEVRLTALSLLNIYRTYDSHRDADESYLWTLFAQKLGDLGEVEISLYLAEKATVKNPQYRDAWIIKGYDELTLKNPEDAELSLLTAYKLDPGNPHTQYLLGLTYFDLGKSELSTEYLLYARNGTKEYETIILEKLAENAIRTEAFPLSAHYFEELLNLEPSHRQALTRLVWLQIEHLNQTEKAVATASQLVEHYPDEEAKKLLDWAILKSNPL